VVWDLPLQGDPEGPTSISSQHRIQWLLHTRLLQRSWHTTCVNVLRHALRSIFEPVTEVEPYIDFRPTSGALGMASSGRSAFIAAAADLTSAPVRQSRDNFGPASFGGVSAAARFGRAQSSSPDAIPGLRSPPVAAVAPYLMHAGFRSCEWSMMAVPPELPASGDPERGLDRTKPGFCWALVSLGLSIRLRGSRRKARVSILAPMLAGRRLPGNLARWRGRRAI